MLECLEIVIKMGCHTSNEREACEKSLVNIHDEIESRRDFKKDKKNILLVAHWFIASVDINSNAMSSFWVTCPTHSG